MFKKFLCLILILESISILFSCKTKTLMLVALNEDLNSNSIIKMENIICESIPFDKYEEGMILWEDKEKVFNKSLKQSKKKGDFIFYKELQLISPAVNKINY